MNDKQTDLNWYTTAPVGQIKQISSKKIALDTNNSNVSYYLCVVFVFAAFFRATLLFSSFVVPFLKTDVCWNPTMEYAIKC